MNNTRTTSTFQWDTVFAIPVKEVNQAIIQQKSSPLNFEYADNQRNKISGSFQDWQIAANGDGKNINMSIPILQVNGSISGLDFALDGATLIIQVNLLYIPAEELQNENSQTTPLHLKVMDRSDDPQVPVVSMVSSVFNNSPTGEAVQTIGEEAVKEIIPALAIDWLNNNLTLFSHVFCTVELNKYIDESTGWTWTKPTDIGYAYVDGANEQESLLGILCMTGGRKRGAEQSDILDPAAIPSTSLAGFLVAENRFLNDLILPTIPLQWENAHIDDFETVPNGDTSTGRYEWVLQLKEDKSFALPPVEYQDGSGETVTQNPTMKSLSIASDGITLTLTAYTETDVGSGVTAWNKSSHQYELALNTDPSGKQTIVYQTVGTPTSTHGTYKTEWAKIEEWMAIAAGLVATIVLGVMTDGAAFVAGALIIGVLTGICADSPDIVATVNTDASPSTDLLTFNTTNPITWANSQVFYLTNVQLNGPFQMGGNPNFTHT